MKVADRSQLGIWMDLPTRADIERAAQLADRGLSEWARRTLLTEARKIIERAERKQLDRSS